MMMAQNKKNTFLTESSVNQKRKAELKEKETLDNPSVVEITKKTKKSSLLDDDVPQIQNSKKKKNLMEKILCVPEKEDKYHDLPITPGINFIKKLFSHNDAEKAIKGLKINIPETFWNDTEIFYIANDLSNGGELVMIKNKKDFPYLEKMIKIEFEEYQRTLQPIEPLLIIRTKISDYQNHKVVESYERSKEKFSKDASGDGLIQRFIRCKGKNRNLNINEDEKKETVKLSNEERAEEELKRKAKEEARRKRNERLSKKANKIMEKVESMEKQPSLSPKHLTSSKIVNNDIRKTEEDENPKIVQDHSSFKLNPSNNNFDRKTTLTKPSVLRFFYNTRYNDSKQPNIGYYLVNKSYLEPSIQSLKNNLEAYSRFCTVSTDIPNSFEIYYVTGEALKQYEYYAKNIVKYLQRWFKLLLKQIVLDFVKDERGIIYFLGCKSFDLVDYKLPKMDTEYLQNEENMKKLYKTITCRLCQLAYHKEKITKIVTFKLLVKLIDNLDKRGKNIFNHIKNNMYNESLSCRLCDLCYKLLITEQELMEIQKTISLCMNIPILSEEEESKNKKKELPEYLSRLNYKFNKINQWRVMFYFTRIYQIELNKLPFDEFHSYKLYIKFLEQKVGIPIFLNMNEDKVDRMKSEVELNLARMFYFFTNENTNMKQILKNEIIDFRIIINDDWNSPLAQCQTACLASFDGDIPTVIIKNTLNFFSDEIKFFKCQAYVGLTNDNEIFTNSINLYNYKLSNQILLSDEDYFSHHPLPDEWFELFLPEGVRLEEENENNAEKNIDQIIQDLDFKKPNKKLVKEDEDEDEMYDPYEELIKMQNKKDMIHRIRSIPVVHDKVVKPKSGKMKKKNENYNDIFKDDTSKILPPLKNNESELSMKTLGIGIPFKPNNNEIKNINLEANPFVEKKEKRSKDHKISFNFNENEKDKKLDLKSIDEILKNIDKKNKEWEHDDNF